MKKTLSTIAILAALAIWATILHNGCGRQQSDDTPSLYELAVWELVRREGISLEAYICPAGFKTIGVGTRTDTLDKITLPDARNMLREDLQNRYDAVSRLLPDHERHEVLAVAMLAHNIGITRLVRSDQWDRIVSRSADCEQMWMEYCYYKDTRGRSLKSENLEQARKFEVALFFNRADQLSSIRENLKTNALKKYAESRTN